MLCSTDAQMALKSDIDDLASNFRAAVELVDAGRFTQARACLDAADRLAWDLDYEVKQAWLDRLKFQRHKLALLDPRHINRFPMEILVRIAQCLEVRDRLAMSQVCNAWRKIVSAPRLWTELEINIRHGPRTASFLTMQQAKKWYQHVKACSNRSNNALRVVRFGGPFPNQLLVLVLAVLRRSVHSLVSIHLPAMDQERCYNELYRYCTKLKSLSINCVGHIGIKHFIGIRPRHPDLQNLPEGVDGAFTLESFTGDLVAPHPGLARHLLGVRVLNNYNPYPPNYVRFRPLSSQVFTPIEEQHKQPWPQIVDSLEEWHVGPHWPSSDVLSAAACQESQMQRWERTLPIRLTFSKLVKLEHFRPQRDLRLEFPQLLQLLHLHPRPDDREFWAEDLGRILSTSPLLEKVILKLHDHQSVQNDWMQAFRGLQHLKEVSLDVTVNPTVILMLFMPMGVVNSVGQCEVEFPLPSLERLTLVGWQPEAMTLAYVLLVRYRLKGGFSLLEARVWASHRLQSVGHHMQLISTSTVQREVESGVQEDQGYKVLDPQRCSSLKVLELPNLREFPMLYEKTLRQIIPKVIPK